MEKDCTTRSDTSITRILEHFIDTSIVILLAPSFYKRAVYEQLIDLIQHEVGKSHRYPQESRFNEFCREKM